MWMLLHARPSMADAGTDPIPELVSKEMKTTETQTLESSLDRTPLFSAQFQSWFLQTKVAFHFLPHWMWTKPVSGTCGEFSLQIHCQDFQKACRKHSCQWPREESSKDFLFESEKTARAPVLQAWYCFFVLAGLRLWLPKHRKHLPGLFATCKLSFVPQFFDDDIDWGRHMLPLDTFAAWCYWRKTYWWQTAGIFWKPLTLECLQDCRKHTCSWAQRTTTQDSSWDISKSCV